MTKQEQIEEMRRELYCAMSKVNGIAFSSDLAEALYNAGYGNVSEYKAEREMLGSQIKVLKQRLNNKDIEVDNLNRDYHNSFERLKAQEREIMQLKAENARLTGRLGQVLLAVDTVKEMNAMCNIGDHFWYIEDWSYKYVIKSHICQEIRILRDVIYIYDEDDFEYYLDDIYFTEEAAKKALEMLQE